MKFSFVDNGVFLIDVTSLKRHFAQWFTLVQDWDFFSSIFDTSGWTARWENGEWTDAHAWLHIASDFMIGLSFLLIPIILMRFIYRKRMEQIPFRSIILLFTTFILTTALTCLLDAIMFWWPAYGLSTLLRMVTAVVSLAAVVALFRITPQLMEFRSPAVLERMVKERTEELEALNLRLHQEAKERQRAELQLIQLNDELALKTEGLEITNRELLKREQEILLGDDRIKQLNHDLEKKVEERTSQLNIINQELEAFTYSVSHDLRAPLRAIDGYARILEEDYNPRIDAHGKHLIAVITKNARYMGQLIDDLLEFSRTSRAEIVKTTFQTDEEVRRIVGDLMVMEKNRNVEVEIKPLATSRGDIGMLRQVWINLVSNALKYSRKNPAARVEIGSLRFAEEVSFYVRDNGVGFDMDYLGKLFGVFQRLHKKDEFEGTGVGLALVKRILDRHNGRIWAEAAVGKGATFYFSLPV